MLARRAADEDSVGYVGYVGSVGSAGYVGSVGSVGYVGSVGSVGEPQPESGRVMRQVPPAAVVSGV